MIFYCWILSPFFFFFFPKLMVACELSVHKVVFAKRMGCKLAEFFCIGFDRGLILSTKFEFLQFNHGVRDRRERWENLEVSWGGERERKARQINELKKGIVDVQCLYQLGE
jgi:hypothetical protein